ncbi:MFS transporter [Falsirhodobacter sp. 20TX0035]|uniref:MFS transporter n=1 Tax=Falsirhodobacter sp. 20TX0035 TaxID=3022019 RepID=UPI002330526E|nr:MFS transporter [Falsirhodobacter sp. 20TX0035]MDB6452052.1 MFS transporter [Falsirhodobacter sp. 20TX0035]
MTDISPDAATGTAQPLNKPSRVLAASLIGTTIEFYDFYIYATAAVLVFPVLFFPGTDETTALLASFATFSVAFFARPFGAIVFGHFGDKIGRKATLVAALLTMGISTIVIGLLPTYASIGVMAPLFLALCRFGQGFGLGGEWGGAVLIATENAPPGKKSWYGMFPQLGAPVGLFIASGVFYILLHFVPEGQTASAWLAESGIWRAPFLASAILIIIGMWVRLSITETPDFQKAIDKHERVAVPAAEIFTSYKRSLFLGTFVALATFVLFYIGTAYLLSYNTKVIKMPLLEAIEIQLLGAIAFGLFIPIVGKLGDRFGRRQVLTWVTVGIALFSFALAPLWSMGTSGIIIFVLIGMALMGMTYGLIGTALAAPFPTRVRYTGSSLTFNFAGIFGASLAPYAATYLQSNYGLHAVGYYLGGAAVITLLCIWGSRKGEV